MEERASFSYFSLPRSSEEFFSLLKRQRKQWSVSAACVENHLLKGVVSRFLKEIVVLSSFFDPVEKVERNKLACPVGPTILKLKPIVSFVHVILKWQRTSGIVVSASTSQGAITPPVSTTSTWPQYRLPRNYSPPYETTLKGGGVFNPRSQPPITQYHAQVLQPPPSQGESYGYSNNPQPSFDPFGGLLYSTTPVIQPMLVLQPSQAAVSIPQVVSTGANRSFFPEMFKQMPPKASHTNNIVESLAVFRQQMEESHHDLVNLLTQQMAIVLTPMIENNNARIEQVARQVNDLAENMNPTYGAGHRNQAYNYNNPPVI
ncbi:hypothetical protein PIB30_080131 [Stylosanthes scabra]|uniref:Uncharacterized protein n=1 Tax=Stylosanthes scabra TaxID=79078 RepID=A0ABU6WPM5_9FABA|nr:hypothetical protein [Stylosanthes scabra]